MDDQADEWDKKIHALSQKGWHFWVGSCNQRGGYDTSAVCLANKKKKSHGQMQKKRQMNEVTTVNHNKGNA